MISEFLKFSLCCAVVLLSLRLTKGLLVYQIFAEFLVLFASPFIAWQLFKFVHELINSVAPVKSDGKAVLITGCDSGFGHDSALRLNEKGFRVYATCMFPKENGAQSLKEKASTPSSLIVLPLDVTKDEEVQSVFEFVKEDLSRNGYKLWCLVNNAGIARLGMIEWGDFDHHIREIVEVNTFGVVKMCRKFLPLLRESQGRIIIITSITAKVFLAYTTAYSMSKRAVLAFADGLRWECRQFGIKVTTIEPNFASTSLMSTKNSVEIVQRVVQDTPEEVKSAYAEKTLEMIKYFHFPHAKFMIMDYIREETSKTVTRTVLDRYPPYSRSVNSRWQHFVYSIMQTLHHEWVEFFTYLLSQVKSTTQCEHCRQFAKVFEKLTHPLNPLKKD